VESQVTEASQDLGWVQSKSQVPEAAEDIGKTDDDQPNCHQGLRPKTTSSALITELCRAYTLGAFLGVPKAHREPLSSGIRSFALSIDQAILVDHFRTHPLLTLRHRRINVG